MENRDRVADFSNWGMSIMSPYLPIWSADETDYFRVGDHTTATRIEMQSINEDKGILDVLFK
jgi:hypothetical protein